LGSDPDGGGLVGGVVGGWVVGAGWSAASSSKAESWRFVVGGWVVGGGPPGPLRIRSSALYVPCAYHPCTYTLIDVVDARS